MRADGSSACCVARLRSPPADFVALAALAETGYPELSVVPPGGGGRVPVRRVEWSPFTSLLEPLQQLRVPVVLTRTRADRWPAMVYFPPSLPRVFGSLSTVCATLLC